MVKQEDEKEKEPRENDKCMEGRKNGDAAGQPDTKKPSEKKRSLKERAKDLKSNKKNVIIIILCVIMIIFFIVIISLAVQLGAKSPVVVPYCQTSKCLAIAAKLKGGLDETFGKFQYLILKSMQFLNGEIEDVGYLAKVLPI